MLESVCGLACARFPPESRILCFLLSTPAPKLGQDRISSKSQFLAKILLGCCWQALHTRKAVLALYGSYQEDE